MIRYLAAGAGLYGLMVGGLYLMQRQLMYFPDDERPAPADWGVPEMEPVTLTTGDGLELLAWYHPAPSADRPVVAYFHGNGGHIGLRGSKVRPFLDAGYGVLLLTYRGYSGNPGRPSEAGLYADGRAALAFLRRRGVAAERMVLYGESLGSGVAVQLATETRVAALVLEAPFSSAGDVAAHAFPFLPARQLVRDRFDSAAKIASVRAPVLVIHGERDRVVPPRFGRKLFEAANEPKESRFIAGAGHNDLHEFDVGAIAATFISRHLDAGPPSSRPDTAGAE